MSYRVNHDGRHGNTRPGTERRGYRTARDAWIGWDRGAREANLGLLTNNTRFLVLPWVTVPHLASHLLATLARRVCADWQRKYGHPIHALETFVDRDRFRGTCYQAANWVRLGSTQGRTRNDRNCRLRASVKDVYAARRSAITRRARHPGAHRSVAIPLIL